MLRRARHVLGDDVALGVGTVVTRAQADSAADAGAGYLVTPAVIPELAHHRLPVLAGALTPSEIVAAQAGGACAIKLFPTPGVGYLRAIRGPFPDVPFVPVGGVDVNDVRTYLAAGAAAVGVGSPLLGDAPHGGDLEALRVRASAFLDAARTPTYST
ncbi:MAG TPA: bifunctional 4-hydroxy-2-oxoglutarate aldolase/2-dehydro-3-deoxy-phosphogluconate aldolase [Actinokineospora sp.]|nr:bifunctional 4-hydroxy-2-oxoglutarate aldolase/2-dehydro-3-deoxy-phosphogluconate aldolase [Actinokineospora sp.]